MTTISLWTIGHTTGTQAPRRGGHRPGHGTEGALPCRIKLSRSPAIATASSSGRSYRRLYARIATRIGRRTELAAELGDVDPIAIRNALSRLAEEGVVELTGETLRASRAARCLNDLDMIAV